MITRLDVFNKVANDIYAEYPNIEVYSKRTLKVKTMPCVWAFEIDSYDLESRSLDNQDNAKVSQFEIQVFSEETNELNKLIDICKSSMKNMCYRCTASQDIDNDDVKISRHFMRFNRVIGGDDNIGE